MLTRVTPAALIALALATPAGAADPPGPKAEPGKHPWYVDDTKYLDRVTARLSELAAAGKCLPSDDVAKKTARDRTCAVTPAKPGTAPLAPEDVYAKALPGVFAVGCVLKSEKPGGGYETGWFATAWAVAADGVLVTNWHVFENPDGAYFGAANHQGEVFPLTDILAVNKKADVAVVKVAAAGLTPLPVAAVPAPVGAWVGVLSHPGHQWFTFTQGHVTRYSKNFGGQPENKGERWMSVTAEFAGGSSGGPVLDRTGAVVGMACLTSNIDFDGEDAPPDDPKVPKPPEKKPNPDDPKAPKPPAVPESRVQMIVKLTVPAAQIRKVIGPAR
jgi:hypothetical protein